MERLSQALYLYCVCVCALTVSQGHRNHNIRTACVILKHVGVFGGDMREHEAKTVKVSLRMEKGYI